MDVGRNRNADPKWLIPLICRVGGITKPQIGSIKTFPEETRFEIAKTHADAFRAAIANSNEEVKITPSEAPAAGMFKGSSRPPRRDDREGGYQKPAFRRSEGGEGDSRPPFKKKPWAPKGEFAGGEGAGKPPFAKKPFKAKPSAAGGKPGGFKEGGFKKAGFKAKPKY